MCHIVHHVKRFFLQNGSFAPKISFMTLQEWFNERAKAKFARRIGVTPNTLSRYLAGDSAPSLSIRVAIEHETNGAVHRERDWPNGETK